MTNPNTFSGQLEDFARFNFFGFVVSDDGAKKAHLKVDVLNACGFTSKQLTESSELVVETTQTPRGLSVERVISLDGIDGHEPASKPAQTEKPKPTKRTNQKRPTPKLAPTESKPITLDMFVNVSQQLDCNRCEGHEHQGERLYGIRTKKGGHVQYVVVKDDIVIRQLGNVSLADARKNIGKLIVHPQASNAGVKTNDPKLSQVMQQSKGQVSGPQRKAA